MRKAFFRRDNGMLKVCILCGCLPAQPGIAPGDLYHQLLAKKLMSELNIQLNVFSVWYTTVAESKNKAVEMLFNEDPEIIFYHVRPDPYLRISKLFLSYRNAENEILNKINLSANDAMIVDKDDNQQRGPLRIKAGGLVRFFRNLNFIAGYFAGVNSAAIKKQNNAVNEFLKYADRKNKTVLVIGPASRPRSLLENKLLQRLEIKMKKEFKSQNYISCFGIKSINGEKLFMEDGVHLSKHGHLRICNLLLPFVKNCVEKNG